MLFKTVPALLLAGLLAACSANTSDTETTTAADGTTHVTVPGATIETGGADGSVVTTNDGESIAINGNGTTQTRALTGQDVQIIGNDNHATYTGQGKEFYIVGNGNVTSIENVQVIQVTGDHNQVQWRGATPTINNIGKDNVISEAK